MKQHRAKLITAHRSADQSTKQARVTFVHKCKACFHPKVLKATHKSRIWFEMLSSLGAMLETHMRLYSIGLALFFIVDLYQVIARSEEDAV
jgi:hypothetical protein